MRGLDLFSGYGGITLALNGIVKPILYCEIEKYAQGILLSRMDDRSLPFAPIWNDITTLDGKKLRGMVDIIYGGFPCQDISIAGRGIGLEGERSGLFYEVVRLTREINPSFVFLENVPNIRTKGLREVVRAFTDLRYDCRWTCISAREVGAPHLRKRWFMLAYRDSKQVGDKWKEKMSREQEVGKRETESRHDGDKELMANTNEQRLEGNHRKEQAHAKYSKHNREEWWKIEPDVGRVVDGCPFRVDRIKSLGNGVVPAQVEKAFKKLIGVI